MHSRLVVVVAVSALLVTATAARADDLDWRERAMRIPGHWTESGYTKGMAFTAFDVPQGVTAAELGTMRDRLQGLFELVRAEPVLAAPMGFTPIVNRTVVYRDRRWMPDGADAQWPMPGELTIFIVFHYLDQSNHQLVTDGHGEGPRFGIAINTMPPVESIGQDSVGPLLGAIASDGEFRGHATWGSEVFLARSGLPPYVPVSQERVIRWRLTRLEAALAETRASLATNEAAVKTWAANPDLSARAPELAKVSDLYRDRLKEQQDRIATWRRVLAGMTPAQRAAPAYFALGSLAIDTDLPLGDPDDPARMPVVQANRAFVDARLPRTAVQSLAVFLPWKPGSEREEHEGTVLRAITEQMPWAALEQLLH